MAYPMIAAALIVVGALMLRAIRDINWDDPTELIPAFLTIVFMITSYSISDGIAIGFISYAFAKLASGRVKECPLVVYIFAVLFALRYALLPATGAIG
jgi:AGZA family xanthine/uracil permease-like MFS transporter